MRLASWRSPADTFTPDGFFCVDSNPFLPTPSACCNPPAGFSRLQGLIQLFLPGGIFLQWRQQGSYAFCASPVYFSCDASRSAGPLPPVHRLFPYPTAAWPLPTQTGIFPVIPCALKVGTKREVFPRRWLRLWYHCHFLSASQMPSAHWRAYPLRIQDDRYPNGIPHRFECLPCFIRPGLQFPMFSFRRRVCSSKPFVAISSPPAMPRPRLRNAAAVQHTHLLCRHVTELARHRHQSRRRAVVSFPKASATLSTSTPDADQNARHSG